MSPWTYLTFAICLEVAGTLLLKMSEGFSILHWGVIAMLCYALCFWMLAPALRDLPVGLAYALWAGLGIVGATALGAVIFGDKLTLYQYGFVALILIGAIGLRVSSHH
ncbi:MAG: multidrug efflux SMR transporter [Pseudomonadota bacterium]